MFLTVGLDSLELQTRQLYSKPARAEATNRHEDTDASNLGGLNCGKEPVAQRPKESAQQHGC